MIDNSENQLKAEVVIPEVSRTEASNWHDTDWNYVNKKVFNLQKQIAKAEREGRGGKVKRLQNLLTRSLAAKRLAVRRVTENQRSIIQDTVIMPAPKKKGLIKA
jgi:RNA-directed DNA polymerase